MSENELHVSYGSYIYNKILNNEFKYLKQIIIINRFKIEFRQYGPVNTRKLIF